MGNQICSWIVGIFSLKYLVRLVKYVPDHDVISKFSGKYEVRYNVRNKVNRLLFGYLSDIELLLPLSAKFSLERKIKKVLGYFFVYFYVCLIVFIIIIILICWLDSVIDYDLKKNTEILKWDANVMNGTLVMKSTINWIHPFLWGYQRGIIWMMN
jgi:hypothetical protein